MTSSSAFLVIALLTLPAAIAKQFARSLVGVMAAAAVLGMVFGAVGLTASYMTDLPTGPMIILTAGGGYLTALILKSRLRRKTS